MNNNSANQVYILFNGLGVATAYFMLALSIWLVPVSLATKGLFGMGIFMLTLALVNLVKYRVDARAEQDRITMLETAKNEKIIQEFITEE